MVYVLYSKFIYSKCEVHIVLQHKNAGQIVKKIILKKQHKSMDTFCRFDKIY